MFAATQKLAIAKLLQDDDERTVELVKEQLRESGLEALPHLKELMLVDDVRVARHAKEIASNIEHSQAMRDFTILCHLFPDQGDLENASWLLCRCLMPGVDADRSQSQIDAWGRRLEKLLPRDASATLVVETMAQFLHGELGFEGNTQDYYNPDNSLMPKVLETRMGIPISLSLLYIFLGKRCGRGISGINLPGHFIAQLDGVLFDPFNEGRILKVEDCVEILSQQKLRFNPGYLEPATSRSILQRMLANLLFIYEEIGETDLHTQIGGWMRGLERQ